MAGRNDPTLEDSADASGGLGTIAPEATAIEVDGVRCQVNRLRMRELMKLVRVLTTGVGDGITRLDYTNASQDEFAQQLFGMAIVGIPEAEDEFAELLQAVVVPVDPRHSDNVRAAMDNPEADLVVDVIGIVIEQEKESFSALLGKLRNLLGSTASLATSK